MDAMIISWVIYFGIILVMVYTNVSSSISDFILIGFIIWSIITLIYVLIKKKNKNAAKTSGNTEDRVSLDKKKDK